MAKICQKHQKGKPYIFTHDPKFMNLFDIWNEEVTIPSEEVTIPSRIKGFWIITKYLLKRKTGAHTNEELENGAIKHDTKKAYFTSTT